MPGTESTSNCRYLLAEFFFLMCVHTLIVLSLSSEFKGSVVLVVFGNRKIITESIQGMRHQ